MTDRRRIMILMGGTSAEREVSLATGRAVLEAIVGGSDEVFAYDYRGDFTDLVAAMRRADLVFNALHGTLGEDGRLQALGDLMHIPYTHSGVSASAIAMNKRLSCDVFARHHLPVAANVCLNAGGIAALKDWPLPLPLVVKPVADGSSLGVRIITDQAFASMKTILVAQAGQQELMFEEYIPGRELTVAVLEIEGVPKALTVTELEVPELFYDYAAKYNAVGGAIHHCPALLEEAMAERVGKMAVQAHQLLGLRGVSRSDFRYDPKTQRLIILETNSQPGMTATSLLPEQAQVSGLSFPALVDHLLKAARYDR